MEPYSRVPRWLLRPLPANASSDPKVNKKIDALSKKLPDSIGEIHSILTRITEYSEYDDAANRASAYVWLAMEDFFNAEDAQIRSQLLSFVGAHMVPRARARVLRRLIKDPVSRVRGKARTVLLKTRIPEVALPLDPKGTRQGDKDWTPRGWLQGVQPGTLYRHKTGKKAQEKNGVPVLTNLAELRELLSIKSRKQLGYFLLASDRENGPYETFTIPKRDGRDRVICAPKPQLRYVQRQILRKILQLVPVHDAAHGFVTGRSTVTNATPHKGAKIILKFDLKDFFPSIHYYRVLGLFASLGYYVEDGRFHADDDATQVAPVLARLCCYTPDPFAWSNSTLPQGAPTSPTISNLVSRRLDARLTGLATKNNGVYTRYADDLTFSFQDDSVQLGRFRWWVDQICHQEGFFVNQSKFRVIRNSQRQTVTGIVVNDEIRVPRNERRKFRAILHNCRKHGIESQAKGRTGFVGYLRGFASYIHMVHPEEGVELLKQVNELLGPETEEEQ